MTALRAHYLERGLAIPELEDQNPAGQYTYSAKLTMQVHVQEIQHYTEVMHVETTSYFQMCSWIFLAILPCVRSSPSITSRQMNQSLCGMPLLLLQ